MSTWKRLRVKLLSATLALIWASVARGATCNELIAINQAIVTTSGGFPFKINQSGSYILTSNLIVADATKDAIDVRLGCQHRPERVSIVGPAAGFNGIGIAAGAQHLITIRNGEVAGRGFDGIQTGHNHQHAAAWERSPGL
jgi:hypothetical protein